MTFKQPRCTASSSSQKNSNKILSQTTISSKASFCRVCGSPAHIINYGALTCQSCRAFFRRHGYRSEIIRTCQFNGKCDVYIQKQKVCIACRLAKCIAAGMSVNYIRKKTLKDQKKCDLMTKIHNTQVDLYSSGMSQISTLDLLHRNRSNLNSSEWTLLSNVVHAYDTFSSIPYVRRIVEQLSKLSIQQPSYPSTTTEVYGFVIASMQSFVRSLPDFQILTSSEQRSLLERNLQGISSFNSALVSRDSGAIDNSHLMTSGITAYGREVMSRAKRLEDRLDPDSTLVKLMLAVLTFSSNCLIITVTKNLRNDSLLLGTFRLLGSQNVYVELLWKYMTYRYGYHETVIRFAHLVKQLLDYINHLTKIYMSDKSQQSLMDDAFDGNKNSFITSRNEEVPLWGNT